MVFGILRPTVPFDSHYLYEIIQCVCQPPLSLRSHTQLHVQKPIIVVFVDSRRDTEWRIRSVYARMAIHVEDCQAVKKGLKTSSFFGYPNTILPTSFLVGQVELF
jgi:hypothetical protein